MFVTTKLGVLVMSYTTAPSISLALELRLESNGVTGETGTELGLESNGVTGETGTDLDEPSGKRQGDSKDVGLGGRGIGRVGEWMLG